MYQPLQSPQTFYLGLPLCNLAKNVARGKILIT